MKNFFIIITMGLIVILATGCEMSIKERIVNAINDKNVVIRNDSVLLNMNDVAKFSWNKMLVVDPCSNPEEINKALGFEVEIWSDMRSQIVFFNNEDKIVHQEIEEYNPDASSNLKFIFNSDSSCCEVYTSQHPYFYVVGKSGNSYMLKKIGG